MNFSTTYCYHCNAKYQWCSKAQSMIPKDKIVNFWCAHGKSHEHGQNIMGVPVTVAMGNAYYVFFCAHGNSHGHAHALCHGHARDYVHGHVYYWQTRVRVAALAATPHHQNLAINGLID